MPHLAILSAAALCLSARASALETLQDRYFGRGWAKAEIGGPLAAPALSPAPDAGGPVDTLHNPEAHMNITRQAYELYTARFGPSELSRFIGEVKNGKAVPDDSVVAGAFDEDKPFKNPWGQMLPMANHFWDCRNGYYEGWNGNDTGLNRAYKYWSGGYGIEGEFDDGWTSSGVENEGVLGLYRKGDKAKAYWYLGHVAHLLEDLTVPAHALIVTHVGEGSDAYETYMKHHFREWTVDPRSPIDAFGALHDLFLRTCDVSNDFDAGSGPDSGADGEKDKGARRAKGFTEEQLKEEGSVLMPLAYGRVASLFQFFFKQVDAAPPSVALRLSRSAAGETALEAEASDGVSGVDRLGYVFESRDLDGDGVWRPLAPPSGPRTTLAVAPARRLELRVTAVDGAGNRAASPPIAPF